MEIIIVLLLLVVTFLEGSLTSIPLVLMCLLTIAASTKSQRVYLYALLAGSILDILTGRILGVTSLVFTLFLGMVFLYQRKYEINSHMFIFIASLLMSIVFGLLFHTSHLFMHVVSSVLFAQILFLLWRVLFLKGRTVSSLTK